jgi:hypothetical protein
MEQKSMKAVMGQGADGIRREETEHFVEKTKKNATSGNYSAFFQKTKL